MADFFKQNYWWIFQVSGCLLIFSSMLANAKFGLSWSTWGYYSFVVVCFTAWMFPLSYGFDNGSKFFANWFISIATLSLCGFFGTFFILPKLMGVVLEPISKVNIIGAITIIIGSILAFR